MNFTKKPKRTLLRRRLREGAIRRAKWDIKLAEDWSVLEEEAWKIGKKLTARIKLIK